MAARAVSHRLLTPSMASSPCRSSYSLRPRLLSTSSVAQRDDPKTSLSAFAKDVDTDMRTLALKSIFGSPTPPSAKDSMEDIFKGAFKPMAMHHLHILSTKHNTHITLTNPDRKPIISKSAGNIGFKKSSRGSYDAAYQLAAFVLGQIYEGGTLARIKGLEVVLRGFGVGREAVTKALLGTEGRRMRPKIAQVTDATRLKFGGTRSRKPRRLG